MIACPRCDAVFATVGEREAHIAQHWRLDETPKARVPLNATTLGPGATTTCSWCGSVFGSPAALSDHLVAGCNPSVKRQVQHLKPAAAPHREAALALLDRMREAVASGDTLAVVVISIKPANDFHVDSAGEVSMLQLAGLLGRAWLDANEALSR